MTVLKSKFGKIIISLFIIFGLLITLYIIPDSRHSVKNVSLNLLDDVQRRVPVLMYHHILKKSENKYYKNNYVVIDNEEFESQMRILYDNGYKAISTDELYKFINGEIDLPRRSVLITFDDGYKSNYIYAYPVLKKYEFKATLFLVGSYVTDKEENFDPDLIQFFNKQDIENTKDVFEFGSHTYNLHDLDKEKESIMISTPSDKILEDLVKSKDNINTKTFAYPYGEYNNDTIELLKQSGFKMAFTTVPGRVIKGTNCYEIPRYTVFPNTTLKDFKNFIGLYNY